MYISIFRDRVKIFKFINTFILVFHRTRTDFVYWCSDTFVRLLLSNTSFCMPTIPLEIYIRIRHHSDPLTLCISTAISFHHPFRDIIPSPHPRRPYHINLRLFSLFLFTREIGFVYFY